MDARLRRWQLGGFLFTGIAGTLLHFLFDWSGGNSLIGAVSAVNESVWEHMKLLFLPMLLFSIIEMTVFTDRYHCFWRAKLLGTLTGLILIPAIYYTYTGALGIHLTWIDISIFYIAAASAYFLEARVLLRHRQCSGVLELPALLILWCIAFAFLFFTYAPPRFPIFRDPVTFLYGIA